MKSILLVKWSTLIISLLLLVGLSSGWAYAHAAGQSFFGPGLSPKHNKVNSAINCGNTLPFGSQADAGAAFISQDLAPAASIFSSVITPTGDIDLIMSGPAAVATGDTFSVAVVAQHVPDPGLYGAQFEINFNPSLVTLSNLQPNPDLSFVVLNEVDNSLGKLKFAASRQGNVPGLAGDVTLLTFDVTAGSIPCMPTLTFSNVKIGDAQANPFNVITHPYTISIGLAPTPTPVTPTATPETPTATPETPTSTPETPTSTPETPTATPETPTATPETPTATPETPTATPETPTATPETPTATPETPTATPETPTATPETPTATPETPTATPETPTATPETPTATPETPTATPETPTATPETPTATPETPTATPETPTATPETPTPTSTPGAATVSGQVILSGRANNDWSGATVELENSVVFSATTDALGNYSMLNVPEGAYTSVTADAPGYLPALCNSPVVTAPLTTLANIALLSGDVNDDGIVNIVDGTAVGVSFGAIGSGLAEDINQDGEVDIFDIILVSVNFGVSGPQAWTCQ